MHKSYYKHIIAGFLMLLLILIRWYEKTYFDDGLIDFFHHDYLKHALPNVSIFNIFWIDSLRFWLNSIISIAIIFLYFKQTGLMKFLLIFYTIAYLITVIILLWSIDSYQTGQYLVLFYTRRFLIQPMLLLLLIPALWYQKKYQ